jgi:hypothetical protein
MPSIRLTLANSTCSMLQGILMKAQREGDLRTMKRINAVFSVIQGYSYSVIAISTRLRGYGKRSRKTGRISTISRPSVLSLTRLMKCSCFLPIRPERSSPFSDSTEN